MITAHQDTDPGVVRRFDARYAGMSPMDKLRRVRQLTLAVTRLALVGRRMREPQFEEAAGGGRVAATTGTPLRRQAASVSVSAEDRPPTSATESLTAEYHGVSAGYGAVLGIPVRRGRWITQADVVDHARVAVVDRALARRLWPGASPLGRQVKIGDVSDRVVGEIADVPRVSGDERPVHQIFVPFTLADLSQLTVVIESSDFAGATRRLRSVVARVDPGAPVSDVQSMGKLVRDAFWQQRMFGGLFLLFAVMASFLAVLGVYGSISYATSVRSHEVFIRVALGATSRRVVLLFTRRGLVIAVLGLALGTVGAVGVSRLLEALLLGVRPLDPVAFSSAILLLGGAAVVASYIPSRRAARATGFRTSD